MAVAAVIVVCLLVVLIPNLFMWAQNAGSIKNESEIAQSGQTYDCIVILGASVLPDGTPSNILKDRLDVGIRLYNDGVAPRIIMSGDDMTDTSYDEVTNMKKYAVSQGVPSSAIFCDHAGLCTYDTAYRLKNVFNAESAVVVTQPYHLYRTLFDVRSFDIDCVGAASDLNVYAGQPRFEIREAAARVSDMGKVVTKAQATYLSEPVSLDQSGDVTTW